MKEMNRIKLKKQFICEASLNWNKSRRLFQNNPKSALKNISHCFRKLDFAFQLLEYKQIKNYKATNELRIELLNNIKNDWNYYEEKYKNTFRELAHKLESFNEFKLEKNWKSNSIEDLKIILREYNSFDIEEKGEYSIFLANNFTPKNVMTEYYDGMVLKNKQEYYRFLPVRV